MKRNRYIKEAPILSSLVLLPCSTTVIADALDIHHSPLYLTSSTKPNVLIILDNSNSMDENPTGAAVGSASPQSKSEIARSVVRDMVDRYMGKINMGLMAYKQQNVSSRSIHNAIYDASFNPANYNPAFAGDRDSTTKRFRIQNPSNPGAFIYYNIALPFYSSGSQGKAFCYSSTADFDNGNETVDGGPWDRYNCYRNKTDTLDQHPSGFSQTIGSYTFSPTDSDYAQNILDFGRFMTWNYVSPTWFSNQSPGKGYLHTPIAELDQTQAKKINTKLATSQFTYNRPTDPSYALQNAGLTPLEGTLETAYNYFKGNLTDPAQGGSQTTSPPEACNNNFIALLTDGLPSTSKEGTPISNVDTALADVATKAATLNTQASVDTYVIGFALPVGTNADSLDAIANAGTTNTAYSASDSSSLQSAFGEIFNNIFERLGSSSSIAANSSSLQNNTVIYQARFDSTDWHGELLAKSLSDTGTPTTTQWDAGLLLKSRNPGQRTIITYGQSSRDGIPFRQGSLSSQNGAEQITYLNQNSQLVQDDLASARIDYIRGDRSSSQFRPTSNILGDIINSSPLYIAPPRLSYLSPTSSAYAQFVTDNANRSPMIFVGANDGMLHGFNAESGEEILAYVPSPAYRNLAKLSDPLYGSASLPHQYFADGSPMYKNVQLGTDWKTVLISGLNAGGQGYFALDITNPNTFSESNAANTLLWEFSDRDDPDLGYTYNQPRQSFVTGQSTQITKMNNNRWAVIFGNGYNNTEADGHASTTGHAYLYILFIEQGIDGTWSSSDYVKLDTGKGSLNTPNGLGTPTPVDTDLDGDIDYIYAGDLLGNLYKFNVTSSQPVNWRSAFKDSHNNPLPLFTATYNTISNTVPQPITSAATITRHPKSGYLVAFGTGRYLQRDDISNREPQTFYAIWDNGETVSGRSELSNQSIAQTVDYAGKSYRISSNNPVNYNCSSVPTFGNCRKGWYMDLPESGERIIYNPLIFQQKFIFITIKPDTGLCTSGGTSWLMGLDYLTGSPAPIFLDTNNDNYVNQADELEVQGSANKKVGAGTKIDDISTGPTIINNGDTNLIYTSNSNGSSGGKNRFNNKESDSGRQSWQQIQR